MSGPVSLESTVGITNRKARELEKLGHRGPAAQLRLQAAQLEIEGKGGIPTRQERAAGNLADSMQMAARYRAASPDFSYEEDILPYKQAVEGIAFGVSPDPRARARFREPIIEGISTTGLNALKERDALTGLRARDLAFEAQQFSLLEARSKFQRQQEAEARVDEMGETLTDIINSPGPSTSKAKKLFSHSLQNPSFYQTQLGSSMYKTALASLPGFESLSPMDKTALNYATRINDPAAIKTILGDTGIESNLMDAMVSAAETEQKRQERISQNYNRRGGSLVDDMLKVAADSVSDAEKNDATLLSVQSAATALIRVANRIGYKGDSIEAVKNLMDVKPAVRNNEESGKTQQDLLAAVKQLEKDLQFFVIDRKGQAIPTAQVGGQRGNINPSSRKFGVPAKQ